MDDCCPPSYGDVVDGCLCHRTDSCRETRKHIGRIRVRETLGSDISLCKVQKGGKEIKAAFDRGDAIVAISTD